VSEPTLSIVTITCRDPCGLRLTLDSLRSLVLGAAPGALEHVVVDGSPDVNAALLAALPASWPLIHLAQPPAGIYPAFNLALSRARGRYVWFLNGGDGLCDGGALAKALAALESAPELDLVAGGALRTRRGRPLYPTRPRRSFVLNLLGRNWICHQATIYRRRVFDTVGPYALAFDATGDYEHHLRCYLAGLRAAFAGDLIATYDVEGGSNDVVAVFRQVKAIQRLHGAALPGWVRGANEIIRPLEYWRIRGLRRLARTRLGSVARRIWVRVHRWARARSR
jgi:glycosyltransferase involved in cell wall biosynthesis